MCWQGDAFRGHLLGGVRRPGPAADGGVLRLLLGLAGGHVTASLLYVLSRISLLGFTTQLSLGGFWEVGKCLVACGGGPGWECLGSFCKPLAGGLGLGSPGRCVCMHFRWVFAANDSTAFAQAQGHASLGGFWGVGK